MTDAPDQAMVDALVAEWSDASNPHGVGDLREVLRAALAPSRFPRPGPDRLQGEDAARALHQRAARGARHARTAARRCSTTSRRRSTCPYLDPVPTGWSERGDDWIDTNNLLVRQNFGIVLGASSGTNFGSDPLALLNGQRRVDRSGNAAAIVDFLADAMMGGALTPAERQKAIDFLNTNDSGVPLQLQQHADPGPGRFPSGLSAVPGAVTMTEIEPWHTPTAPARDGRSCAGCGLTLGGFGLASLFPSALIEHALAFTGTSDKRLLFIFLRGGNDGINAIIPHGDPDYSLARRPTLYVPYSATYDLNGFASLHPVAREPPGALSAGRPRHRPSGRIREQQPLPLRRPAHLGERRSDAAPALRRAGFTDTSTSRRSPAGAALPVISIQSTPPLLLRGEEKFVNIANPENFSYNLTEPKRTKFKSAWQSLYAGLDGLEAYRPVLSQTGVKLADTIDEYASWDQANWNPLDPDNGWSLFPVSTATNQPGFSTQAFEFFRSVKVCALSLLESTGASPNGTRVAGAQLNGWDTHSGQGQLTGLQPRAAVVARVRDPLPQDRAVGRRDRSAQLPVDLAEHRRPDDVRVRAHDDREREPRHGPCGGELPVRRRRRASTEASTTATRPRGRTA